MKLLTTLVSLIASALIASAATTAFNANNTPDNGNAYFGFAVDFTTDLVILESTDPVSFEMDTLELHGRSKGDPGEFYPKMKVAVYAFVGNGRVGDFMGLSDAQTLSPRSSVKFNFTGTTISTAGTYQYLFVTAATSVADLATSGYAGYRTNSVSSSLLVTDNPGPLPQGSGLYMANSLNQWEGSFLPKFTYEADIPEPSTVALLVGFSVLALVGTRRRSL